MPFDDSEYFTPEDIEQAVQAGANYYYKDTREKDWNYTPNRDEIRRFLRHSNDPRIQRWVEVNNTNSRIESLWQEAKQAFYGDNKKNTQTEAPSGRIFAIPVYRDAGQIYFGDLDREALSPGNLLHETQIALREAITASCPELLVDAVDDPEPEAAQ